MALGKFDFSKEAFKRSLALDGSRVSSLERLVDVCVQLRKYEDAVVYYQRIGELIDVTQVWVYIGSANALPGSEIEGLQRKLTTSELAREQPFYRSEINVHGA